MEPRRLHAFSFGAVAAALACGLVVWLVPARRMAPERHLPVAERLPEAARAALKTQMRTHARGMLELTSSVTLLDYDGVRAAVQRILDEPRLARPVTGDATELNAALPDRFFGLQDELRVELQRLARASSARDADGLADAYAATARTCIQCHAAYLTGR